MIKISVSILLIAGVCLFTLPASIVRIGPRETAQKPLNILFFIVDDLRPELGCYGHPTIKSPHIDQLATSGMRFTRAYCNVPVCGASRASLMKGIHPTRNRFWDFDAYAEKDAPGIMTMPAYFRQNGYRTISNGKVFHHADDSRESWSETPWQPNRKAGDYLLAGSTAVTKANKRGTAFERADAPDSAYIDGKIADKTIRDLQRLKQTNQPFFLAAGFIRPHLPFNAPKRYWDWYPYEKIGLAENPFFPKNAPESARHQFGELRSYSNIPDEGPISDSLARALRQAYFACISYTDAQIGRVLAELKRLGLSETTVVVLIGDHGWNLGEHTLWSKHSNFHNALSVPMLVRAPGFRAGTTTGALTEFLDLYPSLCELSGLPIPAHTQGKSFVPLLTRPATPWKEAVFSRFKTGESIQTDRYLYTEWYDKTGQTNARMLYDHQTDPQENVNIAEWPDKQQLVGELSRKLASHVRSLPSK